MKYKASNPNNKTSGASIQSVFAAMGDEVKPILAQHGLDNLDPDEWYPQQDYLDVFNDIARRSNVMFNLVAIGTKILEEAHFPPEIDTVEKALGAMDAYYKLNNHDEDGGWDVRIDGQSAACMSTTPFPADLEYGILYAMTRRFVPSGQSFTVEYKDLDARERPKGHGNPCEFLVTWGKR